MNIFSNLFYLYKRKFLPGFDIKKNHLVVDIGSGDKPFWRADVFVDDLALGDVQRASESKTIHDLGIFVNANVKKLPFKDKTFDFSFCAHLLEHVDDPAKAISEITRVSKAGYLEMPNGIIEAVQPFVSHIWFVYQNRNKLIFVRKSSRMHDILLNNKNKFFSTIKKAPDPFIRLYWKKNIKFEIIDDLSKDKKYYAPLTLSKKKTKSINGYLLLVKLTRFFFYPSNRQPNLVSSERISNFAHYGKNK